VRYTLVPAGKLSPLLLDGPNNTHQLSNIGSPISVSAPQSPIITDPLQTLVKDYRHSPKHIPSDKHNRTLSTLSATIYSEDDDDDLGRSGEDPVDDNIYDDTLRSPMDSVLQPSLSSATSSTILSPVVTHDHNEYAQQSATFSRATSISGDASHSATITHASSRTSDRPPSHAIATPRPTLMFAIASDSVEEVERVLEHGDVGPNDQVGPQSALAFALTNDQLLNKMDIVKTLLGYGADPSTVKALAFQSPWSVSSSMSHENENDSVNEFKLKFDPATRWDSTRFLMST
jgi:hypothetical protein